jgi:hypothetical protein
MTVLFYNLEGELTPKEMKLMKKDKPPVLDRII